jgi:hypothetical protein
MGVPAGTRWLRSLAVGGLLVGALLSGCSGDPDKPATLPSDTPTPSSSTPTPSATPVEQQVEAAVRGYYAELTRAAQTLDTRELKKLTLKGCPCAGASRSIDRTRSDKRRIPDAKWRVTSVHAHDVIARSAGAEVRYSVSAYTALAANGRVLNRFPSDRRHLDLSLIRVGDRWLLANVFDLEG